MSELIASNQTITIALDAMGGDIGPASVIPAAAMVLERHKDVHFLMFGKESAIREQLSNFKELEARSTIHHTDKFIANDEKPSAALRAGKGSSMRLAIEAVRDGQAHAIVSAGNTGALMAMAKIVLKSAPGIHRPAIASIFPTQGTDTIVLDLGANVLVDAENLAQFAVLGAIFAKVQKKLSSPSVGLLNVGTEDTKGPDHVRAAADILSRVEIPGQYFGFVEGTDIMKGTVDVIVSDGYAGNIALKATEGTGKFVSTVFKQSMKGDLLAMIGGLFSFGALKRFKNRMDPRLYNGGVFLGLNGICVKSHGGSDDVGFASAIFLACRLARQGYIKQVTDEINHLMSQDSFLS